MQASLLPETVFRIFLSTILLIAEEGPGTLSGFWGRGSQPKVRQAKKCLTSSLNVTYPSCRYMHLF